jgi:hypothetical protein
MSAGIGVFIGAMTVLLAFIVGLITVSLLLDLVSVLFTRSEEK